MSNVEFESVHDSRVLIVILVYIYRLESIYDGGTALKTLIMWNQQKADQSFTEGYKHESSGSTQVPSSRIIPSLNFSFTFV